MGSSTSIITTSSTTTEQTLCTLSTKSSSQNMNQLKITAIRMILKNIHLQIPFLEMLQSHQKWDIFSYYEELGTLKRIAPLATTDAAGISYQFKAILWTSRLLQDFFVDLQSSTTNTSNGTVIPALVMVGLQPFLTYQEERISNLQLHALIGQCEKLFLEQLIPEFDEFIECKAFKEIRQLHHNNPQDVESKQFFDEFDKCMGGLDFMSRTTCTSSNSLDDENTSGVIG